MIKVAGHDGLARDPITGAIVNSNKDAFQAYLESVKQAREREDSILTQAQELNNMKDELMQIKSMLQQLLNKDK